MRLSMLIVFLQLAAWHGKGASAQNTVGDWCMLKNGDTGVCTLISQCAPAVMLGRLGMRPVICSFQSRTPIVCCGESLNAQLYQATSTTSRPQRKPSAISRAPSHNQPSSYNNYNQQTPNDNIRPSASHTSNQQYPPDSNRPSPSNNNNNHQRYPGNGNRPSPSNGNNNNQRYPTENMKPFRPGSGSYSTEMPTLLFPVTQPAASGSGRRISEQKCEHYSSLVTDMIEALPLLPNPEPVALEVQKCDLAGLQLIVGGNKTEPGEFPHMAAIGFENDRGNLEWKCGGSLISELYVLTAAHCTNTGLGPPVVIRLGEYNLKSNNDGARPVNYRVAKIVRHPDYKPPARYNDIALLKLHKAAQFNKYIRPACLYTDTMISHKKAVATGWGNIDYAEGPSDILLKVPLSIVDNNLCNNLYRTDSRSNHLSRGIVPSMLCAGELAGGRDTCQGDSGGPLQVTRRNNQCVYYIIGVTSFGKYCAAKNAPGVYTRVSHFIPWIESVVWP